MVYKTLDEIPMYPEQDKGFEIKCLNCGSVNCEVTTIGEYNYDEEWEPWGHAIVCKDCGQSE